MSVSADARERAVGRIESPSREPLDLVSFWRAVTEVISPVMPHFWAPCFFTLDPASLLVTSHFHEGLDEFPADALVAEYYGNDVHKLSDVVASPSGISTLHEVTGGDPSHTPRWQFNMTMGGDQELIVRLRTHQGQVWGAASFYREPGSPVFDADDKRFLAAVAPSLADGARTAMLVGEATDPETPDAPGLVLLSVDGELQSATSEAHRWLTELPGGQTGHLPAAVSAVAGEALRGSNVAFSRVLTESGTWVLLHGARLDEGGSRRVAVIIEPAHPARLYPLLMAAYQLTERERDLTRLVLQGCSTREIAETMVISPHTVQQHLKSVFAKTGVRSRRDLVGKLFFAHYEPRLRDNEGRALRGAPLRGGPAIP